MPRYENSYGQFFEAVLDGTTVHTATGFRGDPRKKSRTYDTDDAARLAYGSAIAMRLSSGFKLKGDAKHLSEPARAASGSDLLLDEYLAAGNERFLTEVLHSRSGGKLASIAPKWIADTRPWARAAMIAYVDDGCDRPEHKGLVKRLFKHAEKQADDELMSHFLVAFDTLPRRLLDVDAPVNDPLIRERLKRKGKVVDTDPRFSRATRRYLARRVYRYFRRIARRGDLARYGRGIRHALARYREDQLSTPVRFLDAWGLMHALYRFSPVIAICQGGLQLQEGHALGELAPAPHFPAAWKGMFDELFALVTSAKSRTVRVWCARWLHSHYASELAKLTYAQAKALLTSEHEELQLLGAALLPNIAGLDTLPISEWLELLAIDNLDVVPAIAAVVEKHVSPARLSLAQCIALATGKAAAIANLGLTWAKQKPIATPDDLKSLAKLAAAGVATVRTDGTAWAAKTIAEHPRATYEHLRDLCDAPHADARAEALTVATTKTALAPPPLWFALTESPYDDVRSVVLANATKWRSDAPKNTLAHVWSTALVAVHRGSATKKRVPRAIADRIASHPEEAGELLPILRVALRSVRPAERATALAALARAVHGSPELRAAAQAAIPELVVTEQVTA